MVPAVAVSVVGWRRSVSGLFLALLDRNHGVGLHAVAVDVAKVDVSGTTTKTYRQAK